MQVKAIVANAQRFSHRDWSDCGLGVASDFFISFFFEVDRAIYLTRASLMSVSLSRSLRRRALAVLWNLTVQMMN